MYTLLKYSYFIVLVAFFSCQKTKENTLIKTESKKQWKPLFNGKDLEGWSPKFNGYAYGHNYKNTFSVSKGHLKVSYDAYDNFTNEYGHLFYKTPFSYYTLRLQYRFVGKQAKGGASWAEKNSGVMIHCQAPETMLIEQGFPISLEVQFLGGVKKEIARPTGNLCTPGTHVEINGLKETTHCIPSKGKTYYGEEWVSVEIEVRKDSITHYINKNRVISYANPTFGGQFLETSSKKVQQRDGESLKSGYISLQSESHPIEFKNIEILEF